MLDGDAEFVGLPHPGLCAPIAPPSAMRFGVEFTVCHCAFFGYHFRFLSLAVVQRYEHKCVACARGAEFQFSKHQSQRNGDSMRMMMISPGSRAYKSVRQLRHSARLCDVR